jgi:hypothetical protein
MEMEKVPNFRTAIALDVNAIAVGRALDVK